MHILQISFPFEEEIENRTVAEDQVHENKKKSFISTNIHTLTPFQHLQQPATCQKSSTHIVPFQLLVPQAQDAQNPTDQIPWSLPQVW